MYNIKIKRHIEVKLNFIRDLLSNRVIALEFIRTQENIADPLTKGFDHAIVLKSSLRMGLITYNDSSVMGPNTLERRSLEVIRVNQ